MSRAMLQVLILSLVPLLGGSAFSQPTAPVHGSVLAVPAGTTVEMAVIRPVWSAQVKAGDPLYAQTIFPVTVSGSVAVPPGTYVLGQVDAVTKPTRKVRQALIKVEFRKLVMAEGYTIVLGKAGPMPVSDVTVQTTTANDLLLDNGSQVEMTLTAALQLDAAKVAQALPLSRAPKPGSFVGATRCRATPGSPGTPDTLIGGSPGTPPTVIPGGPGMPDTVIPGIPATPPTQIPGTPSTSPTYCPAPPLVVSSMPETAGSIASTRNP